MVTKKARKTASPDEDSFGAAAWAVTPRPPTLPPGIPSAERISLMRDADHPDYEATRDYRREKD